MAPAGKEEIPKGRDAEGQKASDVYEKLTFKFFKAYFLS
jgi:hypothetical protein